MRRSLRDTSPMARNRPRNQSAIAPGESASALMTNRGRPEGRKCADDARGHVVSLRRPFIAHRPVGGTGACARTEHCQPRRFIEHGRRSDPTNRLRHHFGRRVRREVPKAHGDLASRIQAGLPEMPFGLKASAACAGFELDVRLREVIDECGRQLPLSSNGGDVWIRSKCPDCQRAQRTAEHQDFEAGESEQDRRKTRAWLSPQQRKDGCTDRRGLSESRPRF